VRNIWRLYGGWWDGNPATLTPAPERALAAELADLAGGVATLADRAMALTEQALTATAVTEGRGDEDAAAQTALRLAGHIAELARLAAPHDDAIADVHRRVFSARANAATSTMARGIFGWAAREGG